MIQRLSLNSQCFGVLLWCILNPPAEQRGKRMEKYSFPFYQTIFFLLAQQLSVLTSSPISFSSGPLESGNWVSIVTEGAP